MDRWVSQENELTGLTEVTIQRALSRTVAWFQSFLSSLPPTRSPAHPMLPKTIDVQCTTRQLLPSGLAAGFLYEGGPLGNKETK